MTSNFQGKFSFATVFEMGDGTRLSLQSVDEFQMPGINREVVEMRNVKTNSILKAAGKEKYDDITMKLALITSGDGALTAQAEALNKLYDASLSDTDSVNVIVNGLDGSAANRITYQYALDNCILKSIKPDDISSQGDDALMHVTIVLSPVRIRRLDGPQMK